jgi:hypothetical protein
LSEPGRPVLFLQRRIPGNDLERRGFRDDSAGVGLIHSRGVAGVMPCEERIHSKGLALICKGKGKHDTATELEVHANETEPYNRDSQKRQEMQVQ